MPTQLALRFSDVPLSCEVQERYHAIASCLAGTLSDAEQAQALSLSYSTVARWLRQSYVAQALLESLDVMTNAVRHFDEKGVRLIKPHPDRCREYAERSVGVAALYNEECGFMGVAELAKRAIDSGESVTKLWKKRKRKAKPLPACPKPY